MYRDAIFEHASIFQAKSSLIEPSAACARGRCRLRPMILGPSRRMSRALGRTGRDFATLSRLKPNPCRTVLGVIPISSILTRVKLFGADIFWRDRFLFRWHAIVTRRARQATRKGVSP